MNERFQGGILWTRKIGSFTAHEFIYEPYRVLPAHCHEQAYVSVALGGTYQELCGNREWDCAAGGTIFHCAGECHANRFDGDGARLLVLEISPALLAQLAAQGISTNRQKTCTSLNCLRLAHRIHRLASCSDPLSALTAEGLALELLAESLAHDSSEAKARSLPDWLGTVKQIVHDRYRERLTLDELARQVSVHPVHLARAFRKRYQFCVGDLIRDLRIEAACDDLQHSDLPIAEIAARTGFTDQSHLCRILKRHTGMSPGLFRRAAIESSLRPEQSSKSSS